MTKKERAAIKFAIDTMDRQFNRYCMSAIYYVDENGDEQRLPFGEATNVLEEMINNNTN